ncbi:MAG: PadR family transcriptional regulator [Ruminococcus sp.]|nr:PadR family transcriptional regulator [Ruminococcus sp.]
MNIKKELSKGSSSLLVLAIISEGDKYGYQIIKEIEARSEHVFAFKEGTLYPILHAFEKDGYLNAYWEDTHLQRKRKYYHITDKGLKLLEQSKQDWKTYSGAVDKVVGGTSRAAT